jgi:hypothetical protein
MSVSDAQRTVVVQAGSRIAESWHIQDSLMRLRQIGVARSNSSMLRPDRVSAKSGSLIN